MKRSCSGLLLLAASVHSSPALAQTEIVAEVGGTILSTDGSRILYVPNDAPNNLRLRLPEGQEQIVLAHAAYTPTYGYLTPTGAIFAADSPSQISDLLLTFNGSSVQAIASLNSNGSLVAQGGYAVFSGDTALPPVALPDHVYWMNTTTEQIIRMPGDNGNTKLDVTAQGVIAYWTSAGFSGSGDPLVDYNIVAFDGTAQRRITNILDPIFNIYPVTDGTNFVFTREQVCCATTYSNLILSDGTTETVLRSGSGGQRARQREDYQINAGWIAYRAIDGTLLLRSPSGVTSTVGASTSILSVSEFGDVAFLRGSEAFLRLANGQVFDIGNYSHAFNVGTDWYFYTGGRLVRLANGLLVALDATFAANANPYTAAAGTTLYGVTDISIARAIILTGQTTLDTRGFDILLGGVLSGAGSLDVTGGGTLTLRGINSYQGGTSVAEATLVGDTGSLRGAVANAGTLVFDQDFDGIFVGVLSGTGTVRKIGSGVVTLAGTQPYTGATVQAAGGLHLGALDTPSVITVEGGVLSGAGRIGGLTVSGGTVRPGAAIASSGAVTFGADGTLAIDLIGANASRIDATGPAELGGAGLQLNFAGAGYRLGDSWTILTASQVSGQFGTVSTSAPRLLVPNIAYDATAVRVQLALDRSAFTALGDTPNRIAVAGAAAQLPVSSVLLGQLITLSDVDIRAALTPLTGEVHASTPALIADGSSLARGAIRDRLASGSGSLWGSAAFREASLESSDEASRIESRGHGFILGADAALVPAGLAGAAVWTGETESRGAAGELDYIDWGVGIYARAEVGPLAIRALAGRTWFDIDTNRQVRFSAASTISERLAGNSDATATDVALQVLVPNTLGRLRVTPFAGVRYQRLKLDALVESGGEAALVADAQRSKQTFAGLGIDSEIAVPLGASSARLYASAAWEHRLSGTLAARDMAWPVAAGAPFRIAGLVDPLDLFEGSLGADVRVATWRLGAGVDYRTGSGFDTIDAKITASLAF